MPRFRPIAALLALSALLFAGWTGTTHWHYLDHGHYENHGQVAGERNSTGCSHSHRLETACGLEATSNSASAVPDTSTVPAVQKETAPKETADPNCELCQFLAGNVFTPALSFEFAGAVAVVELLPEPSFSIPQRELRPASCRGPPLFA
jgi:hypothetical protein